MNRASVRVTLATATSPGAVAIVQLSGAGIPGVFQELTGVDNWPIGRVRLVHFGDIDDGMAVLWREGWAQLMPHGGTRVVRKLLDRLAELGCVYENDPPARLLYPEATSDLEADMLATIARAASPAVIDLLLAQPRLWREFLPPLPLGEGRGEGTCESPGIVGTRESPSHPGDPLTRPRGRGHPLLGGEGVKSILAGSATLDRLITPPCVVVVGRPNVGKSTLTNRMLGRAASIVADLPGTTRDWVAGLAEINGVAVRWLDTPGLRASDDPIEQRAIELAADAIRAADMVITMRDGEIDWPEDSALPRKPDIRVMNKTDQSRQSVIDSGVIPISAATGEGVARLERAVVESLGLSVVTTPGLWAFSPELKRILSACDWSALGRYVKTSDSAQP